MRENLRFGLIVVVVVAVVAGLIVALMGDEPVEAPSPSPAPAEREAAADARQVEPSAAPRYAASADRPARLRDLEDDAPRREPALQTDSSASGEEPAPAGGLSMSGRVVDDRGQAVPTAEVRWSGATEGRTDTEPDGTFRATGLEAGDYRLWVTAEGYTVGTTRARAGAVGVRVQVARMAAIAGRVVDAQTGQPVATFEVGTVRHNRAVSPQQQFARADWKAVPDPQGRFEVPFQPGQAALVMARAEGYAPAMADVPPIAPGQQSRLVTLRLQSGAVISGTVRAPDGEALPGAQVVAMPERAGFNARRDADGGLGSDTTDDDGAYHLAGLPGGPLRVYAVHPEYASASVDVTVREGHATNLDITMQQGAVIEGYLTQAGAPVEGIRIAANPVWRGGQGRQNAETDAAGYYRIEDLARGEYRVVVQVVDGPGRQRMAPLVRGVTARSGETLRVDFELPAALGRVEGRVAVADGELTGGRVTLSPVEGGGMRPKRTNLEAGGGFAFDDVLPGDAILQVQAESTAGRRNDARVITVPQGGTERVTLELTEGGTVLGTFTGWREGEQRAVLLVAGRFDFGEMQSLSEMQLHQTRMLDQVEGQGTFRFDHVPPGTHTLLGVALPHDSQLESGAEMMAQVRWTSRYVDVRDGEELEVNLRVP